MENWKEIYLRIADRINLKMPEIVWVDLWHEQVPNTSDEGFPSPAVFVSFHSTKVTDKGLFVQDVELRVDLYLYEETTGTSKMGSSTQGEALLYLDRLTKLNSLFHGFSSDAFGRMRKVDIRCVDNCMWRYLYCVSFECMVEDATAMPNYLLGGFSKGISLDSGSGAIEDRPSLTDASPLFDVD